MISVYKIILRTGKFHVFRRDIFEKNFYFRRITEKIIEILNAHSNKVPPLSRLFSVKLFRHRAAPFTRKNAVYNETGKEKIIATLRIRIKKKKKKCPHNGGQVSARVSSNAFIFSSNVRAFYFNALTSKFDPADLFLPTNSIYICFWCIHTASAALCDTVETRTNDKYFEPQTIITRGNIETTFSVRKRPTNKRSLIQCQITRKLCGNVVDNIRYRQGWALAR